MTLYVLNKILKFINLIFFKQGHAQIYAHFFNNLKVEFDSQANFL